LAGGGPKGRVLIAAGSDSSGGAGIQADIKTVTALGGYAATAITAVTIQNTLGVSGVHDVPADVVERQMRAVIDDIGVDAIKTGMLQNRGVIEAVARAIETVDVPLVVDPVVIATSGDALTSEDTVQSLISLLFPRAAVVTPNVEEAEMLAGTEVASLDHMRHAARALRDFGAAAVLITGGEAKKGKIVDLLLTNAGERLFEAERVDTRHTHGTGCTLASAIATGLAQGLDLEASVERAHAYVQAAIRAAPGFGRGHGPLGHGHAIPPYKG
jgi:hydroxymethylpyrimidine/phosphomethylpyrimidine kinase